MCQPHEIFRTIQEPKNGVQLLCLYNTISNENTEGERQQKDNTLCIYKKNSPIVNLIFCSVFFAVHIELRQSDVISYLPSIKLVDIKLIDTL